MRKPRTVYTPEDKLKIVKDVFSRKTTIQKTAKEKDIAPTLISLWKKQAEDAMLARFQPQPKGRKKSDATLVHTKENIREFKNDARKSKIKAAHLTTSLKETKARVAILEENLGGLAKALGYKLVRMQRKHRTPKA